MRGLSLILPLLLNTPRIIKHTLGRILPKSSLPFQTYSELGVRVSRLQIPLEHSKSKSRSQSNSKSSSKSRSRSGSNSKSSRSRRKRRSRSRSKSQRPAREQEPEPLKSGSRKNTP